MTDQEAYDKLKQERPGIIGALENRSKDFWTAKKLADFVTNTGDSDDLREAIQRAARVVKAQQVKS